MKTLTIGFFIVIISIFGLNMSGEVSAEKARSDYGQLQIVMAEERFQLTTETNLDQTVSEINEDSLKEDIYVPAQFHFLREKESNRLSLRIIFDFILNNSSY